MLCWRFHHFDNPLPFMLALSTDTLLEFPSLYRCVLNVNSLPFYTMRLIINIYECIKYGAVAFTMHHKNLWISLNNMNNLIRQLQKSRPVTNLIRRPSRAKKMFKLTKHSHIRDNRYLWQASIFTCANHDPITVSPVTSRTSGVCVY